MMEEVVVRKLVGNQGKTRKSWRQHEHEGLEEKEVDEALASPIVGNLALAEKAVPTEDERQCLLEQFVIGFVGCVNEMQAPDCDEQQLQRSLRDLRAEARRHNITFDEFIGGVARYGNVNINLMLLAGDSEPEDELTAELRQRCQAVPEIRPQGRAQDPHRFLADDGFDEQTGLAHQRFVAAESAGDLRITSRRPRGMTGSEEKVLPPRDEHGRFKAKPDSHRPTRLRGAVFLVRNGEPVSHQRRAV